MFKRKRARRVISEDNADHEYSAVIQSLSPHLKDKDHAKWWDRWQADQMEFEQSPFLRVVSFTNEVCQAHGLDRKTRRRIRDSLCKSLLLNSNHDAA